MSAFVNFTNHRLEHWCDRQRKAAEKYGTIIDIPFPAIESEMTEKEMRCLAKQYYEKITVEKPSVVLCQGESVFSFLVTSMLLKGGLTVVAAVSRREVLETVNEKGETIKNAVFRFEEFRRYIYY